MKIKLLRLCTRNAASGLLQIGHRSEKWQWRHSLPTWRDRQSFLMLFFFLVKFSYWSKFHVNIITDFGVMAIYFYQGLTRNPEIGNTLVWVLPNIWRLRQVRDTKFGMNVSIKMLLNAEKCKVHSFYCFWLIKGKQLEDGVKPPFATHTPRLGLKKFFWYVKREKHSSTVTDWDSMGRVITQTRGWAFQTFDRAFLNSRLSF